MTSIIGVKKIQYPNGTDILTLDSSGTLAIGGNITSNITTTGTVNTPSINGAQIGGRRNLIINGAMNVAQRGTSSTTNGYGSVDRFSIPYGGGTITHTQEDLSSGSPYDDGFRKHLRLTTNGGSSAASDFCYIIQYLEAQDVANSGWDYTSSSSKIGVSFWVRASLAGTYSCVVKSVDGTQRAFVIPIVLSADTWTKFTKVIPGDSGITVNNDTGTGLEFSIRPYSGTNYSDSSVPNNTWYNRGGSTQTPVYSENWQGTSNATFDLTGVQLEVGSQTTAFEHRSFAEEQNLCQRYFYKFINTGLDDQYNFYSPYSPAQVNAGLPNTSAICPMTFPVTMRAAPTMTTTISGGSLNRQTSTPFGFVAQMASTSTGTHYITQYLANAEL